MKTTKRIHRFVTLVLLASFAAFGLVSCARSSSVADKDTLFQVATLQSLMLGYYDGVSTVGELKQNGTIGIGCFEGVDGELIMLDGTVYQAIYDGSIKTPDDSVKIPYATVSPFENDISTQLKNIDSLETLKKQMSAIVEKNGRNLFYFVRIDGDFDSVNFRSEYVQKKPYKPLAKAMETDQTFFDLTNVSGTIVGLYCPDYMDKLNTPGWHFHFITADKKMGGHLLDAQAATLSAQIDTTTSFKMILTEDEAFQNAGLTADLTKDIRAVEVK
ncbi:MAG: acetolactate decarboxylase [Treponema sp.]|nr:acetolactate decarboxylase [Treponema sp.]